jgi:uncharacterized protein
MNLGVMQLHIRIPGCKSLKEKRSHLKPYLARIHREFNVSISEVGLNDLWQESLVAAAIVSNDQSYTNYILDKLVDYTEKHFLDIEIIDQQIELL